MRIILILKNMGLEITEVVEDNLQEKTASRVAAGAIAKLILKNKLGRKFNIIGAVTHLGLLGCDLSKWNNQQIRKKSIFLS